MTLSLENKLVTIIGGSGFIGSHVAQVLLERGARLRIASRNPEKAFGLKPLANLGQLQFTRCDVRKQEAIAASVADADAVVYLVGTFGADQKALQADGAAYAAQCAADGGAQAFVYMSSIGADAQKSGGYYSTKGQGEQRVLEAFPTATIIRPSAVAGQEEGLVPMFAQMVAMLPVIPVFGAQSQLQPVIVSDLAEAVGNALADPGTHGGKTYEATGPDAMTMRQIYEAMAMAQRRKRIFLPMPDGVAAIVAMLPMSPLSSDQLAMLKEGSTATPGAPQLDKLGVTPRPLSLFLDRWMVQYRKQGRFTGESTSA